MKTAILLCTAVLIAFSGSAFAGGGYIITESGAPSEWSMSSGVSIHPESGDCGGFSNAEMLVKIEDNLSHWTDIEEAIVDFNIVNGSIGGVDGCNYGNYLVGVTGSSDATSLSDGFNPVLFDNDGEIIAAVAGGSNQRYRVLGFANPAGFTSDYSTIIDGQAVFNCRCLSGNTNGACTVGGQTITFSEDELNFTMVHEMGHFLNLDHTQVNADLINDGDSGNDDNIPAMYPVSENAAAQISPMQDDISALGVIYPSSNFSNSHCRVTGELLDSTGQQLRCADVQAIPDDRSRAVAFVSGSYAPAVDNNGDGDTADSGECTSDCGDFELYLDPGVAYTVKVEPINSSFTGGSGISPCANGQLDTVDDETIGTVTAAQCTAGTTVSLGTITTTSTGGVTPSGSVNALYDDEDLALLREDSAADDKPGRMAGPIIAAKSPHAPAERLQDDFYFQDELADPDLPDSLPPRLIGGVRPAPFATTSCPESGGSSSGSGVSSGDTVSTASSSSGGCALDGSARGVSKLPAMAAIVLLLSALVLRRRRRSDATR